MTDTRQSTLVFEEIDEDMIYFIEEECIKSFKEKIFKYLGVSSFEEVFLVCDTSVDEIWYHDGYYIEGSLFIENECGNTNFGVWKKDFEAKCIAIQDASPFGYYMNRKEIPDGIFALSLN